MKKILYLAFRVPFPQTDGYRLRVYNYCKLLKNLKCSVDLFFIYENSSEYMPYLGELTKIFDNIYPIKLSKTEKLENLIKSLILNQSLQENYYITRKGKKQLKDLIKNQYDIYISSYIRMFKYLLDIPKNKIIIDFTDSISFHYYQAQKISKGIWHLIHKYETLKVQKFENEIMNMTCKRMITSPLDKNWILKNYKGKNNKIDIFGQGISEELLSRKITKNNSDTSLNLVFLGKMNYYPNEDAVIYFCNKILPKLNNVKLKIIGISPNQSILNLEKQFPNITVTGFVKDPYKLILEADIMIAPMRIGGGIQNKILEAMALGKVVVSYYERIKSIDGIENYKNIVGVKSDIEMIDYLNNFNKIIGEKIGIEAKKLIKERYTWNIIQKKLKVFLGDDI